MSVLDRSALSESPLADLHAIASELSIDGYRHLRRPELIDAILAKQGSGDAAQDSDDAALEPDEAQESDSRAAASADREAARADGDESTSRRRRGRRGGR